MDGNEEWSEDPICSHEDKQSALISLPAPDEPETLPKGDSMIIAVVANLGLGQVGNRD